MYSNAAAVLRPDINTFVEEARMNANLFIGDKVLPPFPSPTRGGQYPKFTDSVSDLRKDDTKKRSRGTSYPRVTRAYISDNFLCEDRGLEEVIDDTDAADLSRFFDVETQTALRVMQQVMIRQELAVVSALINTTNFASTAAAVAYTQANIATIDLPQDVFNAIDVGLASGRMFNTIAMSAQVFNRVSRSTLLQNLVRGKRSTDSMVPLSEADIASAFGLENCFVGRAAYDSAKKGQTASAGFIWPNTHIWVGEVKTGAFENGGAGRIIQWSEDASSLFVTETYRAEQIRSDVVRVRQNVVEKISNNKAGHLIVTSYS